MRFLRFGEIKEGAFSFDIKPKSHLRVTISKPKQPRTFALQQVAIIEKTLFNSDFFSSQGEMLLLRLERPELRFADLRGPPDTSNQSVASLEKIFSCFGEQ